MTIWVHVWRTYVGIRNYCTKSIPKIAKIGNTDTVYSSVAFCLWTWTWCCPLLMVNYKEISLNNNQEERLLRRHHHQKVESIHLKYFFFSYPASKSVMIFMVVHLYLQRHHHHASNLEEKMSKIKGHPFFKKSEQNLYSLFQTS